MCKEEEVRGKEEEVKKEEGKYGGKEDCEIKTNKKNDKYSKGTKGEVIFFKDIR